MIPKVFRPNPKRQPAPAHPDILAAATVEAREFNGAVIDKIAVTIFYTNAQGQYVAMTQDIPKKEQ